jgi:hypothetical protein
MVMVMVMVMERRMTKIRAGFFLIICASVGVFAGTTDEKQWIRDEHGCRVYNPTSQPKAGESVRWNGSCNQGYAEGPGRLEWFDVNGKSDGWAQGNFEHGYLQGVGEALGPKGSHYRGEFRYSRQNGRGKLVTPVGVLYEGLFRDGQREGLGTTIWPDGMRYEGEYRNGKRDGHGAFIDRSGLRIEVTSRDGQIEGRGTVTWPDGTSYHIEVLNGLCVALTDWHPAAAELQDCKNRGENACKAQLRALANAIGCLPDSSSP